MTEHIQVLTTAGSEVEAAIRRAHSYDEPEIIATEIVAGSAGYLAWIGENVSE
ncbi:MAG: divalent cation tolerance protein CutA [Solirubrobacterales bacterium]